MHEPGAVNTHLAWPDASRLMHTYIHISRSHVFFKILKLVTVWHSGTFSVPKAIGVHIFLIALVLVLTAVYAVSQLRLQASPPGGNASSNRPMHQHA